MFRVVVLYEREPDPARYRDHVGIVKRIPGVTFHHGPIFGSAAGEPRYRYHASLDFADREAFDRAMQSPAMQEAGADATSWGIPVEVMFAELRQE
jgi:uncharacterized protein (TIGR02118 family)